MTLAELKQRSKDISKEIQLLADEQAKLFVLINNEQEKLLGQIELEGL